MKYTIKQFNEKFPSDDACLQYMFEQGYGNMPACPKCGVVDPKYYRVRSKKVYECKDCGNQISPLADTIFHKSETSLRSWFYALFQFSVSKNGVSAKELERTLGVTYKTAWRMAKLIRSLMQQSGNPLSGIVEIDETYIGGKHKRKGMLDNKTAVIGMVEKKKNIGQVAAVATKRADASVALPFIRAMAKQGSEIQTDESKIYHRVKREYAHRFVNHSKEEYSKDGISTNTIEGFWSQMKRSIDGTYHCVSPKYLQNYVNEFVFRYNLRTEPVFLALVAQASRRVK
ncbi:MAG TPA: IS1595 family transposase [Candidatus Saccharimonadales bacterium]